MGLYTYYFFLREKDVAYIKKSVCTVQPFLAERF